MEICYCKNLLVHIFTFKNKILYTKELVSFPQEAALPSPEPKRDQTKRTGAKYAVMAAVMAQKW